MYHSNIFYSHLYNVHTNQLLGMSHLLDLLEMLKNLIFLPLYKILNENFFRFQPLLFQYQQDLSIFLILLSFVLFHYNSRFLVLALSVIFHIFHLDSCCLVEQNNILMCFHYQLNPIFVHPIKLNLCIHYYLT